jgi:hypothetical protein
MTARLDDVALGVLDRANNGRSAAQQVRDNGSVGLALSPSRMRKSGIVSVFGSLLAKLVQGGGLAVGFWWGQLGAYLP